MSNWSDFDNKMDKNFIDDVKNTATSSGDFEEIPLGKYEVAISSMELKESKKGYPMVTTVFKIVEGQYTNRLIFKNSVVYMGDENDKLRMNSELNFLKSLGTTKTVSFEGFAKFEKLIEEIFDEIETNKIEYLLKISERKGFRIYNIEEIFEDEDVPF